MKEKSSQNGNVINIADYKRKLVMETPLEELLRGFWKFTIDELERKEKSEAFNNNPILERPISGEDN